MKSTIKNNMENGKKTIFITGSNGLVGSRITQLLSASYEFFHINRSDGYDISDEKSLDKINNVNASVLIHLAAKADVDGCETEKQLGHESEAWKINVNGTENVAKFCVKRKIKMIHFSTDFVFDGVKPEGEGYIEDDLQNPVNFYGLTKYESEQAVQKLGVDYMILRIAYPYRKDFEKKKDFVRAIVSRLENGQEIQAITDHIFCPTFIDDIASAVDTLMQKEVSGIFHCVGGRYVTPYEAALKIADQFGFDTHLISKTTREKYFQGKAIRPFNLYLKNDKIKNLGIEMKSIDEGLKELKK